MSELSIEEARAWADSIRGLLDDVHALEYLIESEKSNDGVKGVRYDKQGGGTMEHGDDMTAAIVESWQEKVAVYEEKLSACNEKRETFFDACMKLDGLHCSLLVMYYYRGMSWEDVAKAICFSKSYIIKELNRSALESLSNVMPHTERLPRHRAI